MVFGKGRDDAQALRRHRRARRPARRRSAIRSRRAAGEPAEAAGRDRHGRRGGHRRSRRHAARRSRCSAAAATRSTRRSPRPRRSASPSPTWPASAAAASWSSTSRKRPPRDHDRRPRDGARRRSARTRSSTRRPASRIPFSPQRVDERHGGRRARHAGDAGQAAARATGTMPLGAAAAARRSRVARARLRRRPDLPRPDRDNRDALQAFTLEPRALPRAGRPARRRSAASSATPTSRTTYRADRARRARRAFYGGPIGARRSPTRCSTRRSRPTPTSAFPVRPGVHDRRATWRAYTAPLRKPDARRPTAATTSTAWRPPSSGGSTVGEALNILEGFDLSAPTARWRCTATSRRPRLAFADRNRYVGDPDYVDVPARRAALEGLRGRAPLPDRPDRALPSPVRAGRPERRPTTATCAAAPASGATGDDGHVARTTSTVADRWGNVVSYTSTIEQIGGSAIAVPRLRLPAQQRADRLRLRAARRGTPDPNLPAGGKRPRSSRWRRRSCSTTASRCLAVGTPGRRDDHHDRAADPAQPPRLRA